MNKIITPRFLFVVAMIVIAAFSRIVIHIPNITPVFALALFGGAYINKKSLAFLIPLVAMFISDAFIGFYSQIYMIYISIIASVLIGIYLRRKVSVATVFGASLASSVVFFILSNFAVWISGVGIANYPMNIQGFMLCYTEAIPFFGYEAIGTLIYTSVFFGVFNIVTSKYPTLAKI